MMAKRLHIMNNVLIVFIKYPEPGQVKTRLAKDVGDEKACAIYKFLAEGVMKNIFLKCQRSYGVHIFFTPPRKQNEIKEWIKPFSGKAQEADTQYIPQEGGDLGERISHAFKLTLQKKGRKRCVIIGTDCPGIDATLIENAFEILNKKDVVIGPSADGGYYLFGMSKLTLDLFRDIDWSTERVFGQTIKKIQKNNLSCVVLKTLADIDTQEDLINIP